MKLAMEQMLDASHQQNACQCPVLEAVWFDLRSTLDDDIPGVLYRNLRKTCRKSCNVACEECVCRLQFGEQGAR